MAVTAVLLCNNEHLTATVRYALKAEQVAISIVKTPVQIPIPRNSPALIDIGIFRPSITISGLIDEQPENTAGAFTASEIRSGLAGMTKFSFSRNGFFTGGNVKDYYVPYKNQLEEAAYNWLAQDSTPLELELGDAKYPIYNRDSAGSVIDANDETTYDSTVSATGGAVYEVAIQQFRVEMVAAKEDRWQYTFKFVTKARSGVSFG